VEEEEEEEKEKETRFELGNRTSRCILTCNTYSPEYHARRGKGVEKVPLKPAGAAGGPPFAGSEHKRAPEQRSFSFVLYYSSCAPMITRPEFVKELPGPPWLTSRPYASSRSICQQILALETLSCTWCLLSGYYMYLPRTLLTVFSCKPPPCTLALTSCCPIRALHTVITGDLKLALRLRVFTKSHQYVREHGLASPYASMDGEAIQRRRIEGRGSRQRPSVM
jgi:hypothetical protein